MKVMTPSRTFSLIARVDWSSMNPSNSILKPFIIFVSTTPCDNEFHNLIVHCMKHFFSWFKPHDCALYKSSFVILSSRHSCNLLFSNTLFKGLKLDRFYILIAYTTCGVQDQFWVERVLKILPWAWKTFPSTNVIQHSHVAFPFTKSAIPKQKTFHPASPLKSFTLLTCKCNRSHSYLQLFLYLVGQRHWEGFLLSWLSFPSSGCPLFGAQDCPR